MVNSAYRDCYGVRAGKEQAAYSNAPNHPQVCSSEHLGGHPAAAVGAQPGAPQSPALQSEHPGPECAEGHHGAQPGGPPPQGEGRA